MCNYENNSDNRQFYKQLKKRNKFSTVLLLRKCNLLKCEAFINSNQKIFSLHHSLLSRDVSQPSEDLLLDLLNILLTENTPQSLGLEDY